MIFRDTSIMNSIRGSVTDMMRADISTYSSLSIIGNIESNTNEDMESIDDIMYDSYFICGESWCGTRERPSDGKCM